MSQFDNTPIMPPSSGAQGPAGWVSIWIKAVSQPNEQTFIDITEQPHATTRTAFIWVFLAGTVSGIVQAILQAIYAATGTVPQLPIPGFEQFSQSGGGDAGSIGVTFLTTLCLSPVAGLISVIFFAFGAAIVQWIAKLFGGAGTFEKLAYAFAAVTVPFTLVSSLLTLFGAIPYIGACFGILSLGLGIYALVLQVMAVKGVNRFGWGQAAGSVFIPGCVVLILCACVVFGGLMLFGPMIGNVFSEINQSLQNAP